MDKKPFPIGNALPFSTESGNQYLYDNYSGLTFPKETSVLTKLTGDKRYLGVDCTSAPLPEIIDEQTVKAYITGHGYNQLTLEMTADCNFRCRYCIYGEHYPETRTMSQEVIRKAGMLERRHFAPRSDHLPQNSLVFLAHF